MMAAVETVDGTDQMRDTPEWPDAACRDHDADWFPDTTLVHVVDPLRAICAACPRLDECGEWSIETGQEYGVWAGLTGSQRRRIRAGETTVEAEWTKYHTRIREQRRQVARDRLERDDTQRGTVEQAGQIMDDTAAVYGLTREHLTSHDRTQQVTVVRHIAMRRVRRLTGLPYTTIGVLFDRDHTTVIYAINGDRRRR